MEKVTDEYIKLLEDSDPLLLNLNKVCVCYKANGKSFVSRLVKIDGNLLYFRTKSGQIIMNRRDSLTTILPYEKAEEVV